MMKKRWTPGIIFVVAGLLLGACGGTIASPTATSTVTIMPTPNATVSETITPTEEITGPNYYESRSDGYGFELPEDVSPWFGFDVDPESPAATIMDVPRELFIYISSAKLLYLNLDKEVNDLVKYYASKDVEIDPDTFEVDGYPARRAKISGDRSDSVKSISEFIYIDAGFTRLIRIHVYLYGETVDERWEEEVVPLVDFLLESFRIFHPEVKDKDCPVSYDPTYGYSMDNPILLGGGFYHANYQRGMFLGRLSGPDKEPVTVTRLNSFGYEGLWLEAYQLTYEGQDEPVVIYINTGLWSWIAAPMGFSCSEPFSKLEP